MHLRNTTYYDSVKLILLLILLFRSKDYLTVFKSCIIISIICGLWFNNKDAYSYLQFQNVTLDQESLDVHTVSKTKPREKQPIYDTCFTKDEKVSVSETVLQWS